MRAKPEPWEGFEPSTYCYLEFTAYEAIALTRLSYHGGKKNVGVLYSRVLKII